jgi:hypothetical protein
VAEQVEDFVTTDRALAATLDSGDGAREADEKLLVHQDGDRLEVCLYLDRDLVERLGDDDPTSRLHPGNIADYCLALEGVSHFLYLVWRASHSREVSLLELEMQAEVDKYVGSAFLFGEQGDGWVPSDLGRWLFDDPVFDEHLDAPGRARYRSANYYAGKYCSRLESRYLRRRALGDMVNELRRFYRLGQGDKIGRIESRR